MIRYMTYQTLQHGDMIIKQWLACRTCFLSFELCCVQRCTGERHIRPTLQTAANLLLGNNINLVHFIQMKFINRSIAFVYTSTPIQYILYFSFSFVLLHHLAVVCSIFQMFLSTWERDGRLVVVVDIINQTVCVFGRVEKRKRSIRVSFWRFDSLFPFI